MYHSILTHLWFNFYRSCQADYHHAQFRSQVRLFMARILPDHHSGIGPNVRPKEMSLSFLAHLSLSNFIAPVRLIIIMLSIAHRQDFLWPESNFSYGYNEIL